MRRLGAILLAACLASGSAIAQERVVTDDAPPPMRSEDVPHPDDLVSYEQLQDVGRERPTRRNVELAVGIALTCVLLAYALLRRSREE